MSKLNSTRIALPTVRLSLKERKNVALARSLKQHYVVKVVTGIEDGSVKKKSIKKKKNQELNKQENPKTFFSSIQSMLPKLCLNRTQLESCDMHRKHVGNKLAYKSGIWKHY